MKTITSPDNPRIKNAQRLKTSRGRQQQGRMIVFGEREIQRAIAAGCRLSEVFIAEDNWDSLSTEFREQIEGHSNELISVPTELLAKLEFGDRSDGMVATANRPDTSLQALTLADQPLILVLESIEKPGNLGAVVRTADAVAADAILLADPLTDVFHPNSIRSSMGCVFGMPMAVDSTENIFHWLDQKKVVMHAAVVDGETRYDQVSYQQASAILLGNEANGLSNKWSLLDSERPRKINRISLPMLGHADSLNVSTTAAVLCYEAKRQRGFS